MIFSMTIEWLIRMGNELEEMLEERDDAYILIGEAGVDELVGEGNDDKREDDRAVRSARLDSTLSKSKFALVCMYVCVCIYV